MTISYDDFINVDIRSGNFVKAELFPKAKKPAYKVWVNFGDDIGILQTSAHIKQHYTPESLIGLHVMGCLNLGNKNIAGFITEFLLLGFSDQAENIFLATIDNRVPNGQKLH